MERFKDRTGREWNIDLNVTVVKRVYEETRTTDGQGVLRTDVADKVPAGDTRLIDRLTGEPFLLAQVLWLVCRDQAEADGIGEEDFGRSLTGDHIEAAGEALLDEIANFCPNRSRQRMQKILRLGREIASTTEDQLDASLKPLNVKQLKKMVQDRATAASGSSPEGSASTPAPERSEN